MILKLNALNKPRILSFPYTKIIQFFVHLLDVDAASRD